ncbi:UBN2_3 domain-containing protein [Cephalotus follicularis]|uniref:UBN2_3 domain-containing protein n=1 Tax=Cephalotus follicularis TaxID=3775 RepID=A0A1Q3BP05_CEPFO|nr:UBN2_3 domain-containing protein [Cephalotus follicularis]
MATPPTSPTTNSAASNPAITVTAPVLTQSASPFSPNLQHFITIKLSQTNYLLWKTQLTPILKAYNFLDLVHGDEPCPPQLTSEDNPASLNPSYTSWCQRDQLVLSWINASLSETTLPLVIGKNTSAEAWSALAQAFGSPSHTRILQLHMQLQNLKKNDSPISTYLQQEKYIMDELALSPEEFNAIVFNNLGPSFHAIVAALSTRSTPVPLHELHSLLASEEIRLQATNPTIDLPTAKMSFRNQRSDPTSRNNNNTHTSNASHSTSNQSQQNNNRWKQKPNNSNSNSNAKCQICKQNGHLAFKYKYRYHGAPSANTVTTTNSVNHQFLDEWFPDTGYYLGTCSPH